MLPFRLGFPGQSTNFDESVALAMSDAPELMWNTSAKLSSPVNRPGCLRPKVQIQITVVIAIVMIGNNVTTKP